MAVAAASLQHLQRQLRLPSSPATICSFSSAVVGQTSEGITNQDCVRHTGQVRSACRAW